MVCSQMMVSTSANLEQISYISARKVREIFDWDLTT